jgi:hypothetical protein
MSLRDPATDGALYPKSYIFDFFSLILDPMWAKCKPPLNAAVARAPVPKVC